VHASESLLHDGQLEVQHLLHDERRDDVLLQPDDGNVHVRNDQRWRLHYLHERRQSLLRHDSGLLRLHVHHDGGGLHLLHDDE
jgi:hypothetical protein